MNKQVVVPQDIDQSLTVLIFRLDVVIIAIGGLVAAFITALWQIAIIGAVCAYIYNKAQKDKPEGFILHWLYSKGLYGPIINGFYGWPASEQDAGRSFISPAIKRLFP